MGGLVINKGAKIKGTLASGAGDPLLTRDSTTSDLGTITNFGTLTNGKIFIGNVSNVPTEQSVTGDITLSNTGVVAIATGVIVNADVNASAAIALSKLAATTASRALVSDGSGFVSAATTTATEIGYVNGVTSAIQTQLNAKQGTITGAASSVVSSNLSNNVVVVSDGSGKIASSSVSTTILGYISTLTSDAQTQLNTKLTTSLGALANGDIIYYNGSAWTNLPRGTNGQTLTSTGTTVQWNTNTINGIPIGGSAGQYLAKNSGVDFDASWTSLTLSKVTDVTATAAEVNILSGVTTSTVQLNYLNSTTGNIQSQLNSKLSNSLAQNALFVGNASNVATQLSPGTSGYVLTSVSGVPTWQPGGGGSGGISGPGSSTLNAIVRWANTLGTVVADSSVLIDVSGNISGATWQSNIIDVTYGGTGANLTATGGAAHYLKQTSVGGVVTVGTIPAADITSGFALTKVDDTNVTLTLGGTPATSLLVAASLTLGWSGTLAIARGGTGQATANAAFNALAPSQTSNSGKFLTTNGTDTSWGFASTLTNTAANNEIAKSNGTNLVGSGVFNTSSHLYTFGTGLSGAITTLQADGTATDVGLDLSPKAAGNVRINNAATGTTYIAGSNVQINSQGSYILLNTSPASGTSAGNISLLGGNGSVGGSGNNDGGSIFINSGFKSGSGSDGAVYIQSTGSLLSFFNATPVIKQSAVTTPQGIADVLTAYGLLPSSTINTTVAVGSITGLGTGVATWLTTPSWTNFNSAITGTAPFWSLAIGGTITGANTLTHNTAGWLNYASTWTASANNQFARRYSSTITSRSSTSDAVTGDSFSSSIVANAATIDGRGLLISSSFNYNSGITAGANVGLSNPVGGYVSKSVAGMSTVSTFTSVAPTSTSGSGTGALFTVITNAATTFTSFNCTTSGSGYNYGDTLSFNGSLFGGSGSITLAVISVTGNGFALASPLVLQNNTGDYPAVVKQYISGRNSSGAELWEMGYYYNPTNAGVITNNGIYLNDQSGSVFQSTPTALLINKTITNLNPTFTGTTTIANLNSSGIVTFSGTAGDNTSTNSATLSFTGNPFAAVASQIKSNIRATNGVRTGVPATYSVQTAGSGYSNGSATTTGGTGTAASLTLTTSTGTITAAIPSPNNGTGSGTGYAINDVLNVVQVGGSSGQVKVTAIDGYGGIISLAADNRSFTDATSNNNYPSFYSAPTYTLAGSSASTWFGYYNPTYSSFGSGTKAGIVIVPSSALNAFGTATPLSTVDVNGSIASAITLSTGNLTLDATHSTIIITSGSGTYLLPAASGATRRIYRIVNQTGGARTVSSYIDKSAGAQTTVGANSTVHLQSDGSNWYQIN